MIRAGLVGLGCLAAGLFAGCLPSVSGDGRPRSVIALRPTELSDGLALSRPEGWTAPVVELAWGGPPASRRLAVRFADGRFALYRPDQQPEPDLASPPDAATLALAVAADGSVITGDASGLTAWAGDPGQPGLALPTGSAPVGAVGVIAARPGPTAGGDLTAGLADGRLLRFRLDGGRLVGPTAELSPDGSASGIAMLLTSDRGEGLLAARGDGRADRHRADLSAPPTSLGPARALAVAPGTGRLARLVDGPAVVVEAASGGRSSWRFALPAPASGLAFVQGGAVLTVATDSTLLLIPAEGPAAANPAEVRALPGRGWVLGADPDDVGPGRVALADDSGRLEVLEVDALVRRSDRWSLDEAAPLAFDPGRRFHRPRPGSLDADLPEALRRRLDLARDGFDRGEVDALFGPLRAIADDPGLDGRGSAEVGALLAAVEARAGWTASAVAETLDRAGATFARRGPADREADMLLWRGLRLAPPLDGPTPNRVEPARLIEALDHLQRAADVYRLADPPLERQAIVAEAARAWTLLQLGDVPRAARAFAPVAQAARFDPVLGQSAEVDRIARSIAAARGDWIAAGSAPLVDRSPTEPEHDARPGLEREATLIRALAAGALDRWHEAADLLEPDRPDDPEWSARRATARALAGLMPEPARRPVAPSKGDDLALEADLARAESLERRGRFEDAIAEYAKVALALQPTPGDRGRSAARPIRATVGRPYRGLARCHLALGRPARALQATEQGGLAAWFRRSGEDAVRSSAIGLDREDRGRVDMLREAQGRLDRAGGPGGGDDASAALAEVAAIAARLRSARPALTLADPTVTFDPAPLKLAVDEAALTFAAVAPESMVGFLIRPGLPPSARRLGLGPADLHAAVSTWRSGLGDGGRPLASGSAEPLGGWLGPEPELSASVAGPAPPTLGASWEGYLDDALIRPFAADLAGATRLILVADDALAAMPMEVIGRERRLMRRFEVARAPCLATIAAARSAPLPTNPTGGALLLAATESGPTPADLRSWASTYRSAGVGPGADGGGFVDGPAGTCQFLHISAPATLDPARSAFGDAEIRLDPAPGTDGRLLSSAILRAGHRARLTCLILGTPNDRASITGDGLRNMALDALAGGSGAILLTLWDPPTDSSRRFLGELHRALAAGSPPGRALDRARSAVARDPKFRDPVHWAGYVLFGEPAPKP